MLLKYYLDVLFAWNQIVRFIMSVPNCLDAILYISLLGAKMSAFTILVPNFLGAKMSGDKLSGANLS